MSIPFSPRRFRQPRLSQGPGRFRTHPDAVAHPRLRDLADLRDLGSRRRQYLRLHRQRHRRIAARPSAKRCEANGKVVVTGCLGANPARILEKHPHVLAVTGPHATDQVLEAVHLHLPRPHDPHLDLVPAQGIRLTPRHYAYLKISEGCNNKCSFCIIPALRGRLASRPLADVMREAERLVAAGTRELLVISQDTSAYGVDLRYAPAVWRDENFETRFIDLARALGTARRLGAHALCLSLSACRCGARPDGRWQGAALPRHPVPAWQRHGAQAHAPSGACREHARAHPRLAPARCRISRCAAASSSASPARPKPSSRSCSTGSMRRSSTASAASSTRPSRARLPTTSPAPSTPEVMDERYARFMERAGAISGARLATKVGRELTVLVDRVEDGNGHRAHDGRCARDRWRRAHPRARAAARGRVRAGEDHRARTPTT